ncbi:MAG: hypothetical protein JNL32_07140, partial [Candidatus Kapabacteria bacterium]|nr:hypothetical protein [Candidatus Kapabacteria bacterium]
ASIVNFGNGFKNYFPVFFWGMPLLFGLIGMYFHVQRDPKMFWVYLSMFLMMGVLAAVAQNQQEPQPRERDYFYTGSFMVWCLWIGLGVYAIIDYIRKSLGDASLTTVAGGVTVVALIAVPVNMAAGGWKIHTRAGNYLPFDYSYNILQSCEKDAILFTNGDNDTFPLWYLQDVAGIRRDVRVVNLSLGNTLWYLDQLKNLEPWGAKKVPLTFSDESLRANENDPEALSYSFEPEKNISIPVDKALLAKYGADSATMSKGTMDFVFTGHAFREEQGKKMYIVQVQDKLILNILQNVKFTRPVYFSTTSGYPGSETFVGLSDFLRLEGMAYRICPTRQRGAMQGLSVDEKIMDQCLMQTVADDFASPEPKYGFKFRGLNNPDVYFDEHHRNYIDSYRRIFIQYAGYMAQSKRDAKKTVAILDKMVNSISLEQLEMDYLDLQNVADLYLSCGEAAKASKIGKYIVDLTQTVLDKPELRQQEPYLRTPEAYRYYHPALYQCDAYTVMGDEKAAKAALEKYKADVGSDPRALYRAESIGIRVLAAKGNAGEAFKKAQELYQRVPTMPNGMMLMQEASKLLSDMALASGNPNPVPPMMLGM